MRQFAWLLLLLMTCSAESSLAQQLVQNNSEQRATDSEIVGSDGSSRVRFIGYSVAWETAVSNKKRRACEYRYHLVNLTDRDLKVTVRKFFERRISLGGPFMGELLIHRPHDTVEAGMWTRYYVQPPIETEWTEGLDIGLYPATPIPQDLYFTYEALELPYEQTGAPVGNLPNECPSIEHVFQIQDVSPAVLMFQLKFESPGLKNENSEAVCREVAQDFKVQTTEERIDALEKYPQCKSDFLKSSCSALLGGVEIASADNDEAQQKIFNNSHIWLALKGVITIEKLKNAISSGVEAFNNAVTDVLGSECETGTGDDGPPYEFPDCDRTDEDCREELCAPFKLNRNAYEDEVKGLADKGQDLLIQGKSEEEVARELSRLRREIGIKYKDATPEPWRSEIMERNIGAYQDELGPTIEWLRENNRSWEQIINSSSRSDGGDIIQRILRDLCGE